MSEHTANLICCAFVLAAPLAALYAFSCLERWLYDRRTDELLRIGMKSGVRRGWIKRDDVS